MLARPGERLLGVGAIRWALAASLLSFPAWGAPPVYVPSRIDPPAVTREFRGVWVASVNNIDWPSQRGSAAAQQQAELRTILDRAVQLNLNAVILQVRPACDALYASSLEPWSEYLTGRMGSPPHPPYDPLAFAVAEAHQRGLELHAWFNPYRAAHPSGKGPASSGHISRTQPALVKRYGPYQWLDPGEDAVADYSVSVILDVVRRYDIDGVHLDDYFYPYPLKTAEGGLLPFPDEASWQRYRSRGGTASRDDWRRNNVNQFVLRLSRAIKARKSWVKFGISPFGIWRSGHPASVKGLSAVDALHADSLLWLQQGWVDYLSPQLYWSTQARQQAFGELLNWWAAQNKSRRHLWPGLSLREPGGGDLRSSQELLRQIELIRQNHGVSGSILWSAKALVENQGGLTATLAGGPYAQPALIPASPWLDATPPAAPQTSLQTSPSGPSRFSWTPGDSSPVRLWILQTRQAGRWKTRLLSSATHAILPVGGPYPEVIALRAVDRVGNLSPPTVFQISLNPR